MKMKHDNRASLENAIVTDHLAGKSIRQLTREYQISRNTVRSILRKRHQGREPGLDGEPGSKMPRAKKTDPYIEDITRLLERYPKLSAVRVYEEIRTRGYEGGITQLRHTVRQLRPRPKREPVIRFQVEPGHQGQMDWSFYKVRFRKGGRVNVCCFGYVLKHSRRLYVDFCLKRDFANMLRRHRDAFEYFGGVPRECLYDGEKTVLLRWEAGRPVYNPRFIAFLTHYGCRPVGCRPGRPQTKGAIEKCFGYTERNLLAGRDFIDLEDLRDFTRVWMAEKADARPANRDGLSIRALFDKIEGPALQPLPSVPYDTAEVEMRVGGPDGFVTLDTNRYSIPFEYVGEILTVKADEDLVRIYDPEVRLIAEHQRTTLNAALTIKDPLHHPDTNHRYGIEPIRQTFIAIGDAAETFLEGMKQRHPRRAGALARTILLMKERYFSHDINRAFAHAIRYAAFDPKTIEYILKAKAIPRTLESFQAAKASERLAHYDGESVGQRELSDYDNLVRIKSLDTKGEASS